MHEVGIGGNYHSFQRSWEFTGSKRGLTPCPVAERSEAKTTSGNKVFKRLRGLAMERRCNRRNKKSSLWHYPDWRMST